MKRQGGGENGRRRRGDARRTEFIPLPWKPRESHAKPPGRKVRRISWRLRAFAWYSPRNDEVRFEGCFNSVVRRARMMAWF